MPGRKPAMLETDFADGIYRLILARPEKRNAINEALIHALEQAVAALPDEARVIIVEAQGPHFCAGLDLAEHQARDARGVFAISQRWQRAFSRLQESGRPVVVAMAGAVIGGGLELAVTGHVRVADRSSFYQLPEGRHGIFVGGGGSVRIARLIGTDRMGEMMLTGRRVDAEEGARLGLSHYLVEPGMASARAHQLALSIAGNAELANWAIVTALPRIADMSAGDGFYVESLTAALTQTGPEVAARISGFLHGGPNRQGKMT
jgi:(methylthio)acryloyl-CoA hydratase